LRSIAQYRVIKNGDHIMNRHSYWVGGVTFALLAVTACSDNSGTGVGTPGNGNLQSANPDSSGDAGPGSPVVDAAVQTTPVIVVGALSKTTTSEDGDSSTFSVALGTKPTGSVTVALSVSVASEATLDTESLTFDASNFDQPQTVTIRGKDDDVDDGDRPYKVVFAKAVSSDKGYGAITPTALSLTNIDNDSAGLAVSTASPSVTTEKGGTTTFSVRLRTKPTANVTVPIVSATPTEGAVDKVSLTFTADNYKTEQTVTVVGVNDTMPDGDVAYEILIGKTASTDAVYKDLQDTVKLKNVDDDSVAQVVAGWTSTCARFVDGQVKCWGDNGSGVLGLGDTANRGNAPNQMGSNLPFVKLGTGRTVKALSSDSRVEKSRCAILDNGHLKCWGDNSYGQLGYGDVAARGDGPNEMGDALPPIDLGTGRTAKAVAQGYQHTCAILDNDKLKCWGRNDWGNLGYGDTLHRGNLANQMGENLPYVNVGAGRTVKAVAAGVHHTCALLDNNKLKCWGYGGNGQLGYGDTNYRGIGVAQMGDSLPYVDLGAGRTVKAILGTHYGTCAILDNDSLKCWGYNDYGQLGYGDKLQRGDGPNEMGDDLPAIDLGVGRKAVAVSGAWPFSCALLDNATVKCWGYNANGELGLGDANHRGDNPNEMGDNLPAIDFGQGRKVSLLSGGTHASCAVLDDGTVKCWGYNAHGQLGLGDTLARGYTAGQMGDALPIVLLR
jgi:alpha-tubulin suppressor-like RCC1 family protein